MRRALHYLRTLRMQLKRLLFLIYYIIVMDITAAILYFTGLIPLQASIAVNIGSIICLLLVNLTYQIFTRRFEKIIALNRRELMIPYLYHVYEIENPASDMGLPEFHYHMVMDETFYQQITKQADRMFKLNRQEKRKQRKTQNN